MSTYPLTRNVTRTFRQATPEQREAGREWYARARRLAVELADSLPADHLHHGDVERAAAVIAVLSPRTSWRENINLARQAYAIAAEPWGWLVQRFELPTMRGSVRKAARLLCHTDPAETIVSGPKVTAFYRTIADPSDRYAVVVDRHAYDVAVDRVSDDDERTRNLAGKRYEAVCALYRNAARILSRESGELITPAMVQATTWLVWRETRARNRFAAAVERQTMALAA